MKKTNAIKGILYLSLFTIIITIAGCGDASINSKWKTGDIKIDGNDADWGNTLTYVKDLKSLVGIENDNNYLYLCLVTSDNSFESKILRMGLTVWFDRTASDGKKFGVRFPLGFHGMDREQFRSEMQNNQDASRPMPAEIDKILLNNQTDAEIVGANNETNRVPLIQLKGIKLKMTMKGGRMVYEMRMPLKHKPDFSYALSADTGSTISIGLETGSFASNRSGRGGMFSRPEGGEGGEGPEGGFGGEGGEGVGGGYGGEGGGYYGPGGGMRGGYGSRGGGRQFNRNMIEPVKFWAKVKLASE